jgi:6-pyruvoyltetrahydropterin/6-carboxytetrahydropterin synthase
MGPRPFVAGIDPLAGGTWLGVNDAGVVVAVTNRRKSSLPPLPRSRGLLAKDLLAYETAAKAAEQARLALASRQYAGCNFLIADARDAIVLQAGDWLRIRHLPPGIHVLANGDVNDASDSRVHFALTYLAQNPYKNSRDCLAVLRALCSGNQPAASPICYRQSERGTVSSTLIALHNHLAESVLLHAQGPPDQTPFVDLSQLFRKIAMGPSSDLPVYPMTEHFKVRVTKDYLVFCSGHFISYEGDKCERLHGHNYRAAVEVEGILDENHYVFDFIALKQRTKTILDELDHRMMLATRNPYIRLEETPASIRVRYRDREWVFPRDDCVLLPIENTTAELLARYIAGRLFADLERHHRYRPEVLRVEVEENIGQSATCELRLS